MPTPTDNHGYDVYSVGEEAPWSHGPTIESLDTDVEIRDSEANRTNYTPKTGAKYTSTDTGTVYLGSGRQWVPTAIGATPGITEREPDAVRVTSTQSAVLQLRQFEQFSTNSLSIADGGSMHIRKLR